MALPSKLLTGAAFAPPVLRDDDVLLTRRAAAEYVRRSVATLERWAALGEGPPMVRVAGKPLYPLPGLRRFAGVEQGAPAPKRAA